MKQMVVIRSDGNTEIGLGHVIRCLALAQMLKADFSCVFVTRYAADHFRTQILTICDALIVLDETGDNHFEEFLQLLTGEEIVVLDNYFFDGYYQQAIKDKGCKLVCIDDIHERHFAADALINHVGGIQKEDYLAKPYTQFYLGPDFVLLRSAFLSASTRRNDFADNNNLLICLGGADPNNYTLEVLKTLQEKQIGYNCYLVLGEAYIHKKILDTYLQETALKNIFVYHNLTEFEMVGMMQKCAQAVLPPSTISFEYLTVRNGKLFLKMIADNQKDVYSFFLDVGMAHDVSDLSVNAVFQPSYPDRYFDGKSGIRIRHLFRQLEEERKLVLREVMFEDVDLLFRWVNDPMARKFAVKIDDISYEEHVVWFKSRMMSKDSYFWILRKDDYDIGQIRFDLEREKQEATISYFIDECYRGNGYGMSIVKLGLEIFVRIDNQIKTINAIVKEDNHASCSIFDRLNFQKSKVTNIKGFITYKANCYE